MMIRIDNHSLLFLFTIYKMFLKIKNFTSQDAKSYSFSQVEKKINKWYVPVSNQIKELIITNNN